MAKQQKAQEFVKEITPREVNFPQWYTDVVLKTEMVDYAPVRGCMVMRPYGTAIWENIQSILDARFKETGHQNVAMPMLIPESLLLKEAEHVEGFAPEVAWVTQGGGETLAERLAIRPTSEVLFCTMYAKWVQSWRDLPMLYNQWCSVMRWEKTTRPFLRTSEFWWQEGHTIHATAQEAQDEALLILDIYRDFAENTMAMPVFYGQKSEKEKFAGARATYAIEAMMQDGKALQAGTTHNFGTNFSEAYEIMFLDKDGTRKHVHETSWGVSTRFIGGLVMTHGDDRGLKLPPRIAPTQVVLLPIAAHKEGVTQKAQEVYESLKQAGLRAHLDDREGYSAGWKFNEWEMKGVPLRVEIGPRDIENGVVTVCRRDTLEKSTLPIETLAQDIAALLDTIQADMLAAARAFTAERTMTAKTYEEVKEGVQRGFVKGLWCGDPACEAKLKAETSATTRCMPFEQTHEEGECVLCGAKANTEIYFSKAY